MVLARYDRWGPTGSARIEASKRNLNSSESDYFSTHRGIRESGKAQSRGKSPAEGPRQGYAETPTGGNVGSCPPTICVPLRAERSVLSADFHGLHASLGFRPGFEHAVIDNRRRCRRRPFVDNGALLGRRIPDHVKFSGGLCICTSGREGEDAGQQQLLHIFLQC